MHIKCTNSIIKVIRKTDLVYPLMDVLLMERKKIRKGVVTKVILNQPNK